MIRGRRSRQEAPTGGQAFAEASWAPPLGSRTKATRGGKVAPKPSVPLGTFGGSIVTAAAAVVRGAQTLAPYVASAFNSPAARSVARTFAAPPASPSIQDFNRSLTNSSNLAALARPTAPDYSVKPSPLADALQAYEANQARQAYLGMLGAEVSDIAQRQAVRTATGGSNWLQTAGEIAAGTLFEPIDWALTAKEIYNDPRNPLSYAGLIPIVPAGAGKLAKGALKQADRVDDAGQAVGRLASSTERVRSANHRAAEFHAAIGGPH